MGLFRRKFGFHEDFDQCVIMQVDVIELAKQDLVESVFPIFSKKNSTDSKWCREVIRMIDFLGTESALMACTDSRMWEFVQSTLPV